MVYDIGSRYKYVAPIRDRKKDKCIRHISQMVRADHILQMMIVLGSTATEWCAAGPGPT